jgi:hypothetical protein
MLSDEKFMEIWNYYNEDDYSYGHVGPMKELLEELKKLSISHGYVARHKWFAEKLEEAAECCRHGDMGKAHEKINIVNLLIESFEEKELIEHMKKVEMERKYREDPEITAYRKKLIKDNPFRRPQL